MFLNLVIILLYIGIQVNSELITKPFEQYNRDEYMSYGWSVGIPITNNTYGECQGIFIMPRVFIIDAECLLSSNSSGDYSQIKISKIINNTIVSEHSVSNIYYNEDLNAIFDPNKVKIAILITDKSVEPEEDKNGYVQLNSNLNDINTTSCFIPYYDYSNVTFTNCIFTYFDTRDGNPSNLYFLANDFDYTSGSSFFCYLKSDPEVKVLVGIISNDNEIVMHNQSGLSIHTVENLSGLNDTITEKLKTLL